VLGDQQLILSLEEELNFFMEVTHAETLHRAIYLSFLLIDCRRLVYWDL
jgi:hypothetical protein